MRFNVMVGRLVADGTHRAEVGNFLLEIANASLSQDSPIAGQIGQVFHTPIQASPVDVARNRLVQAALDNNCQFLLMLDDDHGFDRPGFFTAALQHLLSLGRPAIVAAPSLSAGPDYQVNVFDGLLNKPTHVSRDAAARRTGIEKVTSIGCGCILYSMDIFRKLSQPWFRQVFDKEHQKVVIGEDVFLNRRAAVQGFDIYCAWDYWLDHYKTERIGRPKISDPAFLTANEEVQAELEAVRKDWQKVVKELALATAILKQASGLLDRPVSSEFSVETDARYMLFDLASKLNKLNFSTRKGS